MPSSRLIWSPFLTPRLLRRAVRARRSGPPGWIPSARRGFPASRAGRSGRRTRHRLGYVADHANHRGTFPGARGCHEAPRLGLAIGPDDRREALGVDPQQGQIRGLVLAYYHGGQLTAIGQPTLQLPRQNAGLGHDQAVGGHDRAQGHGLAVAEDADGGRRRAGVRRGQHRLDLRVVLQIGSRTLGKNVSASGLYARDPRRAVAPPRCGPRATAPVPDSVPASPERCPQPRSPNSVGNSRLHIGSHFPLAFPKITDIFRSSSPRWISTSTLSPGFRFRMAAARSSKLRIALPASPITTSPSLMPALAAGPSGVTRAMRASSASGSDWMPRIAPWPARVHPCLRP